MVSGTTIRPPAAGSGPASTASVDVLRRHNASAMVTANLRAVPSPTSVRPTVIARMAGRVQTARVSTVIFAETTTKTVPLLRSHTAAPRAGVKTRPTAVPPAGRPIHWSSWRVPTTAAVPVGGRLQICSLGANKGAIAPHERINGSIDRGDSEAIPFLLFWRWPFYGSGRF